jgi:2,4-dienoyl-CoA reductase-like NADH-dependent reductase (Old Yellow Enzyme family)
MWKPPERVKHPLLPAKWPSVDEADDSLLFSPIRLGPSVSLRERTWIPAMVPWRATDEGYVTDEVVDWYTRFATGRPGAIVVEATGIRDIPSGPLLRVGHERFVPGLSRLVEAVRRASGGQTRLFLQIIDFLRIRRRPSPDRYFSEFLEITDAHRHNLSEFLSDERWLAAAETEVRENLSGADEECLNAVLSRRELDALKFGLRERVTDVEQPHILDLPQVLPSLFASSAERAAKAGFDGVELHYAHAYTMASFLSRVNTRTDGYGQSRENRVRLPLEVYQAVRDRVGADIAVGCRFLCDDVIEGGSRVDDASVFGVAFARAGMDFISLSTGGKFEDAKQPKIGRASYPYTGRSGYECMPTKISDEKGPFARNVPKQAAIRNAVRQAGFSTPVVVAGGICTFEQAEGILQRGEGDIIGAARQALADPDWFRKMRLGYGHEINRCEYTNYCEALDQQHKPVTCRLWDRQLRDAPGVKLTSDGRRLTAPAWEPVGQS